MGKYDALTEYLRRQPESVDHVTLGFREIETIVGFALPSSLLRNSRRWSNDQTHVPSVSWLSAGWRSESVDLEMQELALVRTDAMAPHKTLRHRGSRATADADEYALFAQALSGLPQEQTQLAVTLDGFRLMARSRTLPKAALQSQEWWANRKTTPQGRAWLAVGWRCEQAYFDPGIVVFRRESDDPTKFIPRYVQSLLQGPVPVVHPAAAQLQRWIRLCRQIGWYFEGTVLYEKGGTALQGLTGEDAEQVEEDYGICKRESSSPILEKVIAACRTLEQLLKGNGSLGLKEPEG